MRMFHIFPVLGTLNAIGGFPSAGLANSTRAAPVSALRVAVPARTASTDAGLKSSGQEWGGVGERDEA